VKELHKAKTLQHAILAAAAALLCQKAFAVTRDEAIANCRMGVGRPIVQACMQRVGGGPENLERCRATASPTVRRCVMNAIGGSATVERPATSKRGSGDDNSKRSKSTEDRATRGVISDIARLPADEARLPVDIRDLENATVSAKTSYENTVKLRDRSLFVAHVTESLNIKILSKDTIEVAREQRRFDQNDKPIRSPEAGSLTYELGKEKSARGNNVVWRFEDSTLFNQVSLIEGAFRFVIPLYKKDDSIKCVVMSGFARENGTGPIRTVGADGSVVEILSSRKISSSCDVSRR
jgi:hypothetical protein